MFGTAQSRPVKVFISYAEADASHGRRLKQQLADLVRQQLIDVSDRSAVLPGDSHAGVIGMRVQDADVILLLMSPDFVSSEHFDDQAVTLALMRHQAQQCRLIPVLVRPCTYRSAPFFDLAALPPAGQFVTASENEDAAWLEVAEGIRAVVEELRAAESTVGRAPEPMVKSPIPM